MTSRLKNGNIPASEDQLLRSDLADAATTGKGADLVGYMPPSTGVPSTTKAFLDSLWSTSASAGAGLIRYVRPSDSVITTVKEFLDSLYASSGSGMVRWAASGTGAFVRTLEEKLREIQVSPMDFGAIGDGNSHPLSQRYASLAAAKAVYPHASALTDEIDWAAIQAAINNSARVYFPAAIYVVNRTINATLARSILYGEGQGSIILTTAATGDIIALGTGSNELTGFQMRDISIDSTVSRTSGWAINARFVTRGRFERVFITPPERATNPIRISHGIYFDRHDYNTVYACHIGARLYAVQARSGAGLFFEGGSKNTNADFQTGFGVALRGDNGGVVFNSVDVIDCGTGIYLSVDLATGINRETLLGKFCTVDGSYNSNLYCEANSYGHLGCVGTWFASAGDNANQDAVGINIAGAQLVQSNLDVKSCYFFNNKGGGISMSGGTASIVGNTFRQNGTGFGFGRHAIALQNAQVSDVLITDNHITATGNAGVGSGILINIGVNNYIVTNNLVRASQAANITDNGGPNKLVNNNLTT
ncbi:right-handed parallel beta-helix repeat-containing protein [Xanthomonas campestris pv. merremiae]|uniref:right-handed parallel beta-helix repeat-containing protein n=1 Tax=Xanthomonas citri TaxID=346 RepID=UPI000B5C6E76|nr:right-handed parallel beta-helix repeat-containing protein [Xanthomonas citri]ASK95390.1 hypothetical protein XcvCFBP7112P_03110 [Xanthomonas citri pv. vignicola]MBV6836254.1 right-handed parallel beta-helix repeat-containing protein [Xanthomonas campestris pv. merremiae]MBZ3933110.1 hypothetical protein [Xanthomonas campestris pv. merremiae]MCC8567064.1 right-handed parallel beta-helix repeat-containing protein [Xanthomonas citri pv. fuscans]